jgi:hypothetical protein
MPTPQEQVAQVEAALRKRFFTLVPKVETPDRVNWTEDQHDVDRLSRALAAYAIVGISNVDDVTAANAITDGKNDGGIDALYIDRSRNRIVLVQSKFKRTGTAPAQDEALKTINGVKALLSRRFNEFNPHFQARLDEIETALDTPGAVLEVTLAYLGDNLGPHVTNDLNALRDEMNAVSERCCWNAHGLSTIHGWLVAEQTPSAVTADFTIENWACIKTPRKAIYGQISAASLAQLVTTHGKSLFQRNIRHYLGSVGVNTAIEETVRRRPGDFFYLNNGLTAVAEIITQANGTVARCVFRLGNVSIVNGAQTAGSVANAAIAGTISPDAKVLVTIIEIGANADDIGLRITKARNHQNVVRGADFAALDPTQERLRQELAAVGVAYHYRPSAESRIRRDDSFTLEEAAVAIASLAFKPFTSVQVMDLSRRGQRPQNAVDFVVTAKKELSRLWDQGGALYGQLFSEGLSGLRMCRLIRVYRFIDEILSGSEASETSYFRRMFFRHGRHFIMTFVARRCADVMNRADHSLSVDDKAILSRRTNEVAEMIFSASEYLQAVKGYLAIFRNLTDAQPLADRVLARFEELDRPAPPPPPAPVEAAAPGAQQGNVQ